MIVIGIERLKKGVFRTCDGLVLRVEGPVDRCLAFGACAPPVRGAEILIGVGVRDDLIRKQPKFKVFLCLSRARLGKMTEFSIESGERELL